MGKKTQKEALASFEGQGQLQGGKDVCSATVRRYFSEIKLSYRCQDA